MQNDVISMKFLFFKCIVVAYTVWLVFLNADICIYCICKLNTENYDSFQKWSLAEADSLYYSAIIMQFY